jgi:hypothetical protein
MQRVAEKTRLGATLPEVFEKLLTAEPDFANLAPRRGRESESEWPSRKARLRF